MVNTRIAQKYLMVFFISHDLLSTAKPFVENFPFVINHDLFVNTKLSKGNYSPPHRSVFLLLNQQLTPISSHCRVDSNCGRDVSRAASPEAVLVISSGTLLA